MHIHSMVETPIIPKKYHKIKNYKKVRQFIIWQIYSRLSSFVYLLIYHRQNHFCLTSNISNPSIPGFNAVKSQDHMHYTDF
jgi:hypothetical protein